MPVRRHAVGHRPTSCRTHFLEKGAVSSYLGSGTHSGRGPPMVTPSTTRTTRCRCYSDPAIVLPCPSHRSARPSFGAPFASIALKVSPASHHRHPSSSSLDNHESSRIAPPPIRELLHRKAAGHGHNLSRRRDPDCRDIGAVVLHRRLPGGWV